MDMYLTDGKGTRLSFPILPDRVSIKTGALSQNFQIINVGEIKIPRGKSLTGYSWNGTFPAEDAKAMVTSFGRQWQKPDTLVAQIQKWIDGNETLRLLITETSVNADVFVEQFNYEYFGTGHVSYTITLSTRQTLTITTTPAPTKPPQTVDKKTYGIVKISSGKLKVRKKASTSATVLDKYENGKRIEILGSTGNWYITPHSKGTDGKGYVYKSYVTLEGSTSSGGSSGSGGKSGSSGEKTGSGGSSSSSSTYKTAKGDTIYSIAKKYGVDWQDLWNLNSNAIKKAGGSLSNVPSGISLQIPSKKKTTTTSSSSSLLQKAASAITTAVSKAVSTFAANVKSLVSTAPTTKKVTVTSTAAKKTVAASTGAKLSLSKLNLTK